MGLGLVGVLRRSLTEVHAVPVVALQQTQQQVPQVARSLSGDAAEQQNQRQSFKPNPHWLTPTRHVHKMAPADALIWRDSFLKRKRRRQPADLETWGTREDPFHGV